MLTSTITSSTESVNIAKLIIKNIDLITLFSTISIALLGWLISILIQGKIVKKQHRIAIGYAIYKEFVKLHMEVQNTLSTLNASSRPPFIIMETIMIVRPQTSIEITHVIEAGKEWEKFINKLNTLYFDFTDKYLEILYLFSDWEAAFKSLAFTKNCLSEEINSLKSKIYSDISILQMYTVDHGYDWRKWDRKEIEIIINRIAENILDITSYLGDFMILLHNETLSNYFKQKREIRMTTDPRYRVLTKKGIVENLDVNLIEKMKKHKSIHDETIEKELLVTTPSDKKNLNLRKAGICPDCNTDIEVKDTIVETEKTFFSYTCGHGWNVFSQK
ncbi:MAG: hypothetical protein HOE53_03030 [Candidatus Magasanikbacteria bacterium]|jgi:hypothetical protein|nr:hypothetical protein [Candidatus Magasanikbacteria bacterium]